VSEERVAPAAHIDGSVDVPGDKSISHRALILGAIAKGRTYIGNASPAADVLATASCLRACGAWVRDLPPGRYALDGAGVGVSFRSPDAVLDCGNSGTTMRLLAGALAGNDCDATLDGDASLRRRPMARVVDPLRAMGDGVVTFVGQQTGYGNVIMLKHDGRYSTVYAHLSRFADETRDGARIHQGETIGYVGQTGWATGPHLHYELRVDGEPRDPMTVALPMATPVTDQERASFASAIAPLAGELAVVRELPVNRLVAAN
jgi:hypothetical protein